MQLDGHVQVDCLQTLGLTQMLQPYFMVRLQSSSPACYSSTLLYEYLDRNTVLYPLCAIA